MINNTELTNKINNDRMQQMIRGLKWKSKDLHQYSYQTFISNDLFFLDTNTRKVNYFKKYSVEKCNILFVNYASKGKYMTKETQVEDRDAEEVSLYSEKETSSRLGSSAV